LVDRLVILVYLLAYIKFHFKCRRNKGFSDDEFDSFPSAVQNIFLDRVIKEYIIELDDRIKYRDYYESVEFYDCELYASRSIDEYVKYDINIAVNEYIHKYIAEY
jgi:hypothetical protein